MLPFPSVWGKQHGLSTRYPLALHLRDTSAAALVLWDVWLRDGLRELLKRELGPNARSVLAYVAGSHDVGKANSVFEFQRSARSREPWMLEVTRELKQLGLSDEVSRRLDIPNAMRRHEQVSAFYLDKDVADGNLLASEHWRALAVLGHHGMLSLDSHSLRGLPKLSSSSWSPVRESLLEDLKDALKCDDSSIRDCVDPVAIVLINGLTIVADRIASTADSVMAAQMMMDEGQLDSVDAPSWISERYKYFQHVIPEKLGVYNQLENPTSRILRGKMPRPLQLEAMDVGEGLWFAMAATGSGKTEAALLRHSRRSEQLLFLLPTQATTNAMMNRVTAVYEGTPNIASLAHGLSSTNDFYRVPVESSPDGELTNGLFPSEFLKNGGARLLAPVSVATIDQAIMASLPLRWTPLRLLALANSHVVIDEAHTMDSYQTLLAEGLLWWLGRTGARVTVLSATLPTWQRDVLAAAYNADSDIKTDPVKFPSSEVFGPGGHSVTELTMEPHSVRFEQVRAKSSVGAHTSWARAMRVVYPQSRIGIVVNQIPRAQQIAKNLEDEGVEVIVLHSRMTARHRRQVENRLHRLLGPSGESGPVVVVGTQTIEASLDIDFDLMSTDLAPSPSLVQRAGRVWRRADRTRSRRVPGMDEPTIHVVQTDENEGARPYLVSELRRAWDHLEGHPKMESPEDVQDFVEAGILDLDRSLEDLTADDLDEVIQMSRQRKIADQRQSNLSEILRKTTTVGQYRELTWYADQSDKDTDADYPTTRLIESETGRVVLVGDPTLIPGAWDRPLVELESLGSGNRELANRALDGMVPLSRKLLREALNAGSVLPVKKGPLSGVVALEVRGRFSYHSARGLEFI